MSRRGSAQLLLLSFRSRARLGWTLGAIVSVSVVAGLLQAGGDFPLLSRLGVAQMIRQSVWHHALAGLPEQPPWPWADEAAGSDGKVPSLGVPSLGVPSLGLSAAVGKDAETVVEPSQPAAEPSAATQASATSGADAEAEPAPAEESAFAELAALIDTTAQTEQPVATGEMVDEAPMQHEPAAPVAEDAIAETAVAA